MYRLRREIPYSALFLLLFIPCFLAAKVQPSKYGVLPVDSLTIRTSVAKSLDSLVKAHPQTGQQNIVYAIMRVRPAEDKTPDFYLLLGLVMILGLIRLFDPRYFETLWTAIKSPGAGGRPLKEKLQTASVSNMLMNVFFTMSAAAYVFYVVKNFTPQRTGTISPSILIIMLIAGMMVIYLGKYAVIRFSGWAFKVEPITEYYLFNIFLINKALAIVLLPFIIIIAFSAPAIAQPALIVSFVIILTLFINRYLRSWQVFGSFFQYSKFHFFTYLCASELLPLAVLMKLLVRGLLY
jgi:hypothetical protein